ncbi:MAG: L,D-transpeptidase family protein [Pseudomonadota bacterium]
MTDSFRQETPRGYCRAAFVVFILASSFLTSPARAETFALADGQAMVGAAGAHVTSAEDTLLDIARDNDLGYGQIMAVNDRDLDPWLPGAGHNVVLPNLFLLPDGPRQGIVIDLAAQRLYYFPKDGATVQTYPIGTGAEAGMTPRGTTKVVGKVVNPVWYVPKSIRKEQPDLPGLVRPGPDNPLGAYAFRLGWPSYLIHGTNKPYGIGRNVSHGCIHLYPEDIETLFKEVTIGTPVRVVDDEMRFAWVDGTLYLALAPTHAQITEISENQKVTPSVPEDLQARVAEAAGDQVGRIDWRLVAELGIKRPGMPVAITSGEPMTAPADEDAPPVAEATISAANTP